MKRTKFWVPLLLVMACQGVDSGLFISPVLTDPSLGEDQAIEKIAVIPFASSIHDADDPDGLAPRIMDKYFTPALDERNDYAFIAPNTVLYAIDREGWMAEYTAYMDAYATGAQPGPEFLGKLAEVLKCDAFLIPVVDVWYQDQADRGEDSASSTQVGATITIIDQKNEPGSLLFRSYIEEYLEAARTETADRGGTSSAGIVSADRGARLFRAPPFDDVATRVVELLIESLPQR
jgi:hypothetical protein